jgi:hypothetical protein
LKSRIAEGYDRECHIGKSTEDYKALSDERSPGFDTVLRVIKGGELKLHAVARQDDSAASKKLLKAFDMIGCLP